MLIIFRCNNLKEYTARGIHRNTKGATQVYMPARTNVYLFVHGIYVLIFNYTICHLGAWSIATIEVALTARNGTQAYNS